MLCRQRKEKILKLQDHLSVNGVAVTVFCHYRKTS